MRELLKQLAVAESGQDLIEYALLTGFITLGVVTATTNLGQAVENLFTNVEAGLP